jgi:hypothetical protein
MDRLPPHIHDVILRLRNGAGKTWDEISALSAEPVGEKSAGFIEWGKLSPAVRKLFPGKRIARTTLHRWYDLRVRQVQDDVRVRSEQARVIAESFAKSALVNGDEAVINAARDTLMGVLSEDGTSEGRLEATKGLIKLGELMQKARTNAIRDRKVSVDEQVLQLKLDSIKQKAESVIHAVEGESAGAPAMSRDDVIRTVREIYGVA